MKNPSGMCQCGCGKASPLAKTSRRGYKRGEPLLFIKGHSSRALGPDYTAEDRGYRTPCWIWAKSIGSAGYGRIWAGKGHLMAHRVYYEANVGPIPEGLQIDHLCRQRACVNPEHLEPVTHAENGRRGIHAKLSHDEAAHIRRLRDAGFTAREIAMAYCISMDAVYDIDCGRTWAA